MLALWYHAVFAIFFAFLAVLLMAVILLQRGRGVGLAGAFGGSGGNTAFGAKTGDALTWITVVLASVFLLIAIVLNYWFVPVKSELAQPPAQTTPAATDGSAEPASSSLAQPAPGVFAAYGDPYPSA